MCQPKELGGKRCLRHSKATVAEVQFTWAKTKVDKENIYAILKTLNKEGRKLDAPELAEVNAFLDKEEFKVKLDPDLSERDRKMILKNLDKARDEAEKQGVTGGAFHAWKNVFKATVEKMKKPLMAIGLTGVLVASLSGCVGALDDTNNPSNSPEPTGTVACSTANPGPYGDVIPKEDITDENGTYCQTTLDPTSEAYVYDASKVDMASLEKWGFTEADAKKAQEETALFVAEEVLDSSILDAKTAEGSPAKDVWIEKNGDRFSAGWEGASTDNVVYTNVLPTLVRDGNPRVAKTAITVASISAQESATIPGEGILVVKTASTANYRISDDAAVDFLLANGYTGTREALIAEQPSLADGKENVLPVNVFYAAGFNTDGKISGVSFEYAPESTVYNNG